MANKRYDEFAAGTPIGTDITLYADPATGELKKVALENLDVIPQPCKFSDSLLINANNDGTNPQDIGTLTIPAAIFDVTGRWVEIIIIGETLVTTGTPIFRTLLGSTDPAPLSLSALGQFRINVWLQRVSGTQYKAFTFGTRVLTNTSASSTTTINLNAGNNLVITARITAAPVADRVFVLGMNARVFEL